MLYLRLTDEDRRIFVTADVKAKGNLLYRHLLKQLNRFWDNDPLFNMRREQGYDIWDVLKKYITKDVCKYVSYECLLNSLKDEFSVDYFYDEQIKDLYMHNLGFTDENTLYAFEKYKVSHIDHGCPPYLKIEDKSSFMLRKKLEKKREMAEARKKQHKQQNALNKNTK